MPNEIESLIKRCVDELSDDGWEILYEEFKKNPHEDISNIFENSLKRNQENNNDT